MLSMTQHNLYQIEDSDVFNSSIFDYEDSSNGDDTSFDGEESYDQYDIISFNNTGTISPNWLPLPVYEEETEFDFVNPNDVILELEPRYQQPSYYLVDVPSPAAIPTNQLTYDQNVEYIDPLIPTITGETNNYDFPVENVNTKKREREPDTHTTAPRKKFKKPREKWSELEEDLFVSGIRMYGRDYRKVEAHVKTKTIWQIRSHAQKYFLKQKKKEEQKIAPTPTVAAPKEPTIPKESIKKEKPAGPSAASSAHLPSHNTPWTDQERKLFLEGLATCGKGQWKKISEYVGTRNALQVKNHARQYFKKLSEGTNTKNVGVCSNTMAQNNASSSLNQEISMLAQNAQACPQTLTSSNFSTPNFSTCAQNTSAIYQTLTCMKANQAVDEDEELEIDDAEPMPVIPSPILVQTETPVMQNSSTLSVTTEPRSRGVTIEHNVHVKVTGSDSSHVVEPSLSVPVAYQDPFSSDFSPFSFTDLAPEIYHYY